MFQSEEDMSLEAIVSRHQMDDDTVDISAKISGLFGRVFEIEPCLESGPVGHVWIELNVQNMAENGTFDDVEPEESSRSLQRNTALVNKGTSDQTTIVTYSVMIHVTKEFEESTDIESYVDVVISETNLGYINSGIPLRVKKHCIVVSDIRETGHNADSWDAFKVSGAAERIPSPMTSPSVPQNDSI